MRDNPTWSYYMITSNVAFEQAVGRLADRTRKFYNGRIKVATISFMVRVHPRLNNPQKSTHQIFRMEFSYWGGY